MPFCLTSVLLSQGTAVCPNSGLLRQIIFSPFLWETLCLHLAPQRTILAVFHSLPWHFIHLWVSYKGQTLSSLSICFPRGSTVRLHQGQRVPRPASHLCPTALGRGHTTGLVPALGDLPRLHFALTFLLFLNRCPPRNHISLMILSGLCAPTESAVTSSGARQCPPLATPTARIPLLPPLRHPAACPWDPATRARALAAVPAHVTQIPITYLR